MLPTCNAVFQEVDGDIVYWGQVLLGFDRQEVVYLPLRLELGREGLGSDLQGLLWLMLESFHIDLGVQRF